jgi:hypothetical protein
MKSLLVLVLILFPLLAFSQSSMRRCTLLPVTDSVGGAIGYKVFEEVEKELRSSAWCTYVSNSEMISVFSRYRENLATYLKNKEVIQTVAGKLNTGSIIRITLTSELRGVELQMSVHADNGEDLLFSEKTLLKSNEIPDIVSRIRNWLKMYSKMIPYDATVNGILGDQLTMEVGKDLPLKIGQKFIVKRLVSKKKHPLLKKVVDWNTIILAEGVVFNLSGTQALGIVKSYKVEQKLQNGDWVRFLDEVEDVKLPQEDKAPEDNNPGTLGIFSASFFGGSSSLSSSTATNGSNRWSGSQFGLDLRGELWITRMYFVALEVMRGFGSYDKDSGTSTKKNLDVNTGTIKLTGGYKYLPIGFFFGPQIDLYAGYLNQTYGVTSDTSAGLADGDNIFSGILLGVGANVPLSREYKFYTRLEFLPFPSFSSDTEIYGSTSSVSSLDLEVGLRYQLTVKMSLDGGIELRSNRAKFKGEVKDLTYRDNILKLGASYNF